MLKLFATIAGFVLIGLGIKGVLSGSVMEGGKGNVKQTVERDQEPANFWGTCIFYIGFGGFILYKAFVG